MPENISFAMLDKEDLDEFSDYLNEEALALSGRADTFFYGAFQEEDELAAVLSVEVRSDEDQIRILSIAVTPALQHTGIGSALIDYAVGEAIEAGFAGLVVFLEADTKGVGEFDPFFWRCGFSPEEAYPVKKLLLSELVERLDRTPALKHLDLTTVRPLAETDSYLQKKLARVLKTESGFTDPSPENVDPQISMVYLKGTDPVSCLLVGEENNQLQLKYIFVSKKCDDWTVFEKLIARAVSEAVKKYGEDCYVVFSPVSEGGLKMLLWFWGQRKTVDEHTVMVWKLPLRGEITESAEEKAKEKPVESESRFTDDGFRLLTNAELKCRDCTYRLKEEGVLECHKYSTKPAEIIAGGNCACYRA